MRKSRSGFAPGASRSISLSIVSGNTFFSNNASVRKIITVSETIEHASSGHMKMPPLVKNPAIVWKTSNMLTNHHSHSHLFGENLKPRFPLQSFWRQRFSEVLGNGRKLGIKHGL